MTAGGDPAAAGRGRDWIDAAILTGFLWFTIVMLYLPVLLGRHPGEGLGSAAIEGATVLHAIACGMLIFWLHRAIEAAALPVRVAALGAAIVALAAVQTVVDFAFTWWIARTFKPEWSQRLPTLVESYTPFFTYVCLFAFNVALFQLVLWRRRAAIQRVQLAHALLAARQAELTALRFQLNPHFLFNSLNAISSLIVTRRNADAEEMTNRLSGFLRSSLAADPSDLVPLDAELATVEEYLAIESVRFGERMLVEVAVTPAAADCPVPNFILQPLAENAVKYGVARAIGPVTIRIAGAVDGDRLVLMIANDLPAGAAEAPRGTGVGLANVAARLAAIYGDAADLAATAEATRFRVVLRLPVASPA